MRAASYQQSSYLNHASFRSRLTSFLLALAIVALVVFMLIELGIVPSIKLEKNDLITVTTLGGSKTAEVKSVSVKAAAKGSTKQAPKVVKPTSVVTPPPPKVPPPPIPWIPMSREELAQADISTKPTRSAAATSGDDGDNGKESTSHGSTYGPGEGPGGEQIYDGEWNPAPTEAEMAPFLPQGGRVAGWGEVICTTIPHNRVENCQTYNEQPGSGFAKALRLAAWQFHIKTPAINGKPLIGIKVRLRYTLTIRPTSDQAPSGQ
jgi:protein TonB